MNEWMEEKSNGKNEQTKAKGKKEAEKEIRRREEQPQYTMGNARCKALQRQKGRRGKIREKNSERGEKWIKL